MGLRPTGCLEVGREKEWGWSRSTEHLSRKQQGALCGRSRRERGLEGLGGGQRVGGRGRRSRSSGQAVQFQFLPQCFKHRGARCGCFCLVQGRVWTAGTQSSRRRPRGETEGTDSGESKDIKSTGIAERLVTGVRERGLSKMCTWGNGGPD